MSKYVRTGLNPSFIKKNGFYILVFFLILSFGINGYFVWKQIEFSSAEAVVDFPLLSPLLAHLQYDSAEERRANTIVSFMTLRQEIEGFLGDQKSQVGVYVEDFNTGTWLGVNEKQQFIPASLIKVAFAMAALKKVDRGVWTMDTPLLLQPKYKNKKYGELWKLSDFTDVPLHNVIQEMIVASDNTAVSMIYYSLTKEERDDVFYHIGQRNPDENPEFPYVVELYSPKELATAYRVLYNSSFLTRTRSQYLLDLLSRTQFRQEIPRGIPSTIIVAHKIGEATSATKKDLSPVSFHDCGIVYYPQRPYLICVMTEGIEIKQASEMISDISTKVYRYIDEYDVKLRS